ncbi:kelch domain-containing protein 1 isoform X1 [Rhinichthys klamathensis goyatoka]|uniref:kelch domain-containing protein 1 isoform X1 n=1 Tax=Rhinichthys klamathensis goyatoka TaxID=3034132 RepID=UPI0024B597E6|nr:kelch domain-containing protein 1 isoform X1 [Rhinichthys klamathensis goyatoka]
MSETVARERSGHTAAADGQYLYVWGGYVSVAEHEVFLPNDELWLYDLETGLWLRRGMSGTVPPSLSGTCGCIVNGLLYIFGGCCDDGQTNELYSVDLHDGAFSWKKLEPQSGSPPSPRDKLSCWVHKGRMVYFGGYGHKLRSDIRDPKSFAVDEASWAEDVFWGWSSETHEFDPGSRRWTEPQTFGRAPAPRAAHASATIGSKGFVCGGRIKETRTCDVFCLDLNSWTWSEIVSCSVSPSGRSWHTLSPVSDSALFLFGGLSEDCRPMSDGWLLDLETRVWARKEHPHEDKPRLWHSACPGRDSDVIVFGGSHDYILLVDKGHCNDALVFQTQPYPLIRYDPEQPHTHHGEHTTNALYSHRLCQDFIANHSSVFQSQILCLPPKLRRAVENRTSRTSQNLFRTAQ